MTFLYSSLRIIVKTGLLCFFKKVRVEGLENFPKNTPIIIAPNHQNALIDALLAACFLPMQINYLTRSDVFNKRTKPLLKFLNMIPIYRIRDGYSKLSQNDAVFETCRSLFKENKAVLIFPEGNHGEHHFLRPLTKGTSRLALQSQEQLDNSLQIVPIGFNFFSHREPRSTVIIKVGKPIDTKKFLADYEESNAKGLMALRDEISEGMKETLIIPTETDDYLDRRDAVFNHKNDSLPFDALRQDTFQASKKKKKSKHIIGKILNPIPFLILHKVISGVKDKVFYATLKFGIGLLAFPIWWIIVLIVTSFLLGIKIASLTVFVMIFGLFFSYRR